MPGLFLDSIWYHIFPSLPIYVPGYSILFVLQAAANSDKFLVGMKESPLLQWSMALTTVRQSSQRMIFIL